MTIAGFYGDDFTGSVDALLQFRRAGLSGVLVTGPAVEIRQTVDVVGIAGTARSLPTAAMAAEVVPALWRLRELGPDIVQYKACSTADSAPHVGSIGRVLEFATEVFPGAPVPIVFAQPGMGRYTFFSHHFARDDGAVYRLDRQPTMSSHPITPIRESDLRMHLGTQTELGIGAVHWPSYDDPDALGRVINDPDRSALVCDAVTEAHLDAVARAILAGSVRPRFVVGSGGISGGLGRCARVAERLPDLTTTVAPAVGPTLVLNGSRSRLTRRQLDAATAAGWIACDLFAPDTAERVQKVLDAGAGVLVDAAGTERPVDSAEIEAGLAAIGEGCLRDHPAARLVLSGGDTSGNVLRRLGIERLEIVAEPWGNVPLCRASRPGAEFELVLKGGQMGHMSLFDDVRRGCALNPLQETAC